MAAPKTRPTKASVKAFLDGVGHAGRRQDAREVDRMMRALTGHRPVMWGPNIVGYGTHDWVTADGKSTPWPIAAFSPRSTALVVYILPEFPEREPLLAKLGKHSIGKSCLYIKRLEEVDRKTLAALVKASMPAARARA